MEMEDSITCSGTAAESGIMCIINNVREPNSNNNEVMQVRK